MNSIHKSAPGSPFRSAKLSLVQKLIVNYAAMAFFTLAALSYSIYGLYSLNRTAREIANNDLTVISTLTRMRTSLLAQEGYAGRYAILGSSEFVDLFHQREKEFLGALTMLSRSRSARETAPLDLMYRSYRAKAALLFAGERDNTRLLRANALQLLAALDDLYDRHQKELREKLSTADQEQRAIITWTLALSLAGFMLAIVVAAIFVYRTSAAIRKLKAATHRIAEGDFNFDPRIPAGDEFGELARDFTSMAERLKVLEQMSLDASPLTRLPGNIAIERVLTKRLQNSEPFAVCYADLDNFKGFNDRYGYIQGSELIRETGEIIYEAVKTHADQEAFVGHVGGDDFVMVVAVDAVSKICEAVIDGLSAAVPKHYNAEDLARGGIEGVDRYGVTRFFPLMTISIAVVICSREEFASAVDIARTAAEVKDYVKEKPGSSYFISRRKYTR